MKRGQEVFGAAPVVFVGVERRRLEGVHLPPSFTGVTHVDDSAGTVEAALLLQPDTTEVAVVAGSSAFDRYWLDQDKAAFQKLAGKVRFRYLVDMPAIRLLEQLRHLKPHTVVFVHSFYRDGAGEAFTDPEAFDLITTNSNAPVYGLTTSETDRGFVGGRSTGHDDRRYPMAFQMVYRLLGGDKVSAIPIRLAEPRYPYIFDARRLRRWAIDPGRLPPGSLLLNQEPSFWQLNWKYILAALTVFAVAGAFIVILLFQLGRRKRIEALLGVQNARLKKSQESLRKLSGELISAQEDERKRIARELHDELGQELAILGIAISNIRRSLPPRLDHVQTELSSLQAHASILAEGLRQTSHKLHPASLELYGFAVALERYCDELSRIASIPIVFESQRSDPVLDDRVALCLYRIAQESLHNAIKHSSATSLSVRLSYAASLELVISDNGIGFDLDEALNRSGLGLRSMQERIRLIEGHLDIISQPGAGTTVIARLAVPANTEFRRAPTIIARATSTREG